VYSGIRPLLCDQERFTDKVKHAPVIDRGKMDRPRDILWRRKRLLIPKSNRKIVMHLQIEEGKNKTEIRTKEREVHIKQVT
jgi:glycerol-3-phosphate dehydrogenase